MLCNDVQHRSGKGASQTRQSVSQTVEHGVAVAKKVSKSFHYRYQLSTRPYSKGLMYTTNYKSVLVCSSEAKVGLKLLEDLRYVGVRVPTTPTSILSLLKPAMASGISGRHLGSKKPCGWLHVGQSRVLSVGDTLNLPAGITLLQGSLGPL